jgi:hypothetical protein
MNMPGFSAEDSLYTTRQSYGNPFSSSGKRHISRTGDMRDALSSKRPFQMQRPQV